MAIGVITHPDCLLHEMGRTHPEQPDRVRVISRQLAESGLDTIEYIAPLATPLDLLRVHSQEHVNAVIAAAPDHGLISLDPDTWMNPHTLDAVLRAAGAVISAVDRVMQQEISAAFCNVRPPGHHAEHNRAMGFCFFNNLAVGVAYALEKYNLQRIAIVDFDVHHGNGTEDIFQHDTRVLLCSSFQHPFYPFGGAETRNSHIINIPMPAGSSGKNFREKITERWLSPLAQFQPELIFFSAGFDGHAADPLANLNLHEGDFAWVTREVKKIAEASCSGRMISVLEGGYALEVLGKCVVAHVDAMQN
jgi:acetoin utilization deacetylase AcuC-like enzyme